MRSRQKVPGRDSDAPGGHWPPGTATPACWGSTPFTTLTSANLNCFRQQIPPDALTKAFLDAIHIAQALGFAYLWIDSLCIIQDSPEDWDRESALMEDVYGASSLTIAATSAEDGSVGCFFDRTPNWRHQILQRQSMVLWDVFTHRLTDPKLHPLSKRAWALQERWLSRRTLHFTRHQVFWECDGNPASETYPRGYPRSFITAAVSKGFLLERRPLPARHWSEIVKDYSSRLLTKMSDTLPAISGIAKMIQEQTKGEYVAGMWREGLEDQLTWSIYGSSRVSSKYIAPSWSWVSVSGDLDCHDDVEYSSPAIFHVRVQAISIQHLSANSFGEIAGATLRLGCEILWPEVVRDAIWREPSGSTYQATSFVFSDIKVYFCTGGRTWSVATPWTISSRY
ncbi:heterokaryon incompatibility protein-domain-containing protein [Coniochaeta sp. 2T2.1]|nr:heterokaryon incompatibility protein-domain-containing protein [Coniochaeta sp. 2T2.1]